MSSGNNINNNSNKQRIVSPSSSPIIPPPPTAPELGGGGGGAPSTATTETTTVMDDFDNVLRKDTEALFGNGPEEFQRQRPQLRIPPLRQFGATPGTTTVSSSNSTHHVVGGSGAAAAVSSAVSAGGQPHLQHQQHRQSNNSSTSAGGAKFSPASSAPPAATTTVHANFPHQQQLFQPLHMNSSPLPPVAPLPGTLSSAGVASRVGGSGSVSGDNAFLDDDMDIMAQLAATVARHSGFKTPTSSTECAEVIETFMREMQQGRSPSGVPPLHPPTSASSHNYMSGGAGGSSSAVGYMSSSTSQHPFNPSPAALRQSFNTLPIGVTAATNTTTTGTGPNAGSSVGTYYTQQQQQQPSSQASSGVVDGRFSIVNELQWADGREMPTAWNTADPHSSLGGGGAASSSTQQQQRPAQPIDMNVVNALPATPQQHNGQHSRSGSTPRATTGGASSTNSGVISATASYFRGSPAFLSGISPRGGVSALSLFPSASSTSPLLVPSTNTTSVGGGSIQTISQSSTTTAAIVPTITQYHDAAAAAARRKAYLNPKPRRGSAAKQPPGRSSTLSPQCGAEGSNGRANNAAHHNTVGSHMNAATVDASLRPTVAAPLHQSVLKASGNRVQRSTSSAFSECSASSTADVSSAQSHMTSGTAAAASKPARDD